MKATKITVVSIVLGVLTLLSCTKEPEKGDKGDKGDAGRNGIDGINGTNGNNGTNGTNGQDGEDGNANVQSQTFTVNTWTHFGTVGQPGDGYYVQLNYPAITNDIVSTGAVIAYMTGVSGAWVALPYSEPKSSYTTYINYTYQLNQALIQIQDSDFFTPQPSGTTYIKIVVISSAARLANPELDYTNYYEVKGAFNLKD